MIRRSLVLAAALLWACGEPSELEGMRSAGRHPEGWALASGHGQFLEARGYPLDACYGCHAVEGTRAEGACNSCHEQGVNDCETCHAEPGGAHDVHVRFGCETCHVVPGDLASPGHLEDRGAEDVRFAGAAVLRGHAPAYDAQTRGCSDTACHAGAGAALPVPRWNDGSQPCGACHGTPPPNHPNDRCDRCHGEVVDAAGEIIDASKHADGVLQARDWLGFGCGECHGQGDDPWPTTAAHPAHKAPAAAKPVACATCHTVPADSADPGHVIDDTPRAEVRLAPVAGADATFAAGACSNTTCHGSARPTWTGAAECGSCHGVPPVDHPPGDCVRCHSTAGPEQSIAEPLAHVDGRIDVAGIGPDDCAECQAAGGRAAPAGSHAGHARFACTECHRLPDPANVVAHL
ncbi:MAG: CxxxxCH/CxxCH domain-containing protein, partial [Myxococcales bacterium]|nr:CxxxxCH/CxxCH domain-containing protein [Myxococcales bacterium]